jgi:uncharacterized protein DUF4339
MADWYCKIDGTVYGPYNDVKLRELAANGRLLPEDSLRDGDSGPWFAAEEIANLFPKDSEDVADRIRIRKGRDAGKGSNYYAIFGRNISEGGNWQAALLGGLVGEALLKCAFPLLFAIFQRGSPVAVAAVFLNTFTSLILFVVFWIADAITFGIPCLMFRTRFEKRSSVLDVITYCHVIALGAVLIRLLVWAFSRQAGIVMFLLMPLAHAGILAYFASTYWKLPGSQTLLLVSVRCVFHLLVFLGVIVLMIF